MPPRALGRPRARTLPVVSNLLRMALISRPPLLLLCASSSSACVALAWPAVPASFVIMESGSGSDTTCWLRSSLESRLPWKQQHATIFMNWSSFCVALSSRHTSSAWRHLLWHFAFLAAPRRSPCVVVRRLLAKLPRLLGSIILPISHRTTTGPTSTTLPAGTATRSAAAPRRLHRCRPSHRHASARRRPPAHLGSTPRTATARRPRDVRRQHALPLSSRPRTHSAAPHWARVS